MVSMVLVGIFSVTHLEKKNSIVHNDGQMSSVCWIPYDAEKPGFRQVQNKGVGFSETFSTIKF